MGLSVKQFRSDQTKIKQIACIHQMKQKFKPNGGALDPHQKYKSQTVQCGSNDPPQLKESSMDPRMKSQFNITADLRSTTLNTKRRLGKNIHANQNQRSTTIRSKTSLISNNKIRGVHIQPNQIQPDQIQRTAHRNLRVDTLIISQGIMFQIRVKNIGKDINPNSSLRYSHDSKSQL